jgi:hypothetical protein
LVVVTAEILNFRMSILERKVQQRFIFSTVNKYRKIIGYFFF